MQWMQEGQFDVLPPPLTTTPFWAMTPLAWASEGGPCSPWILKSFAKKIIFFVLNGKKQISPLLPPLEKFWKNPLVAHPWKISFRRPWLLVFQDCVTCECNQFLYISLAKKVQFMFFINISCSKKHIKSLSLHNPSHWKITQTIATKLSIHSTAQVIQKPNGYI